MSTTNTTAPLDIKDNIFINEYVKQRSLESAYRLLLKLRELKLNIITAESLTAGLIAKTLVDIPTFGANIYGGIIVYDSDAKRKYLNVKTADVYSNQTAKEMAEGALLNSRAMVAIAVTGHAGPIKMSEIDDLGIVDIGVSVRLPPAVAGSKWSICTETKQINNCRDNKNFENLCQLYKKEFELDFGNCLPIDKTEPFKCSSLGTLSLIRNIIRTNTVALACQFALDVLVKLQIEKKLLPIADNNQGLLDLEKWDGDYLGCAEPTPIIEKYLNKDGMKKKIEEIAKTKLITPTNTFAELVKSNPNIFTCAKERRKDPQCLAGGTGYKNKYLKYKSKYMQLKKNMSS